MLVYLFPFNIVEDTHDNEGKSKRDDNQLPFLII